ncbi:MAG: hypothetical protein BWY21_01778 [Parcubacteria group bacterium ADurb.Bin216]|jgi:hypothetical protein|nr:MAG: hypothetical protein BWY21_01778 [Parcubacteria group bacterium ADurb.Bin216]
MKTKKQTKERKQLREVSSVSKDLKAEFETVYNDYDVIDELAMCEIEFEDE